LQQASAATRAASLLAKAEAAAISRDYVAAIELYQRVLHTSPLNEPAQLGLARAYREVRNYDQMRRILTLSARQHPKSGLALVELGKLELHAEHYDAAIQQLSEAVRLQPRLASARVNLGVGYQAKGDHQQAIAQFNRA